MKKTLKNMKKTLSIILILLLSASCLPNGSGGWFAAFDQFFEMNEKIRLRDILGVYWEGLRGHLTISESFDRIGTLLYCPQLYPASCRKERGSFILEWYEWEEGCRGYIEDCCVARQVNCRDVLLKGEKAAQHDIKLRDKRAMCIHHSCGQLGFCHRDANCRTFVCPDFIGGPSTPKCDPDLLQCYCAGSCGDGFCDWREMVDKSCPEDCVKKTGDEDADGLSDWNEINVYGTDSHNPDTDGDGMDDGMEILKGSDPLDPDSDDGGQCDGPSSIPGVCRSGPDTCPLDSNNLCFVAIPLGKSIYNYDSDSDGLINALDPCPLNHSNICAQGDDPPMVLRPPNKPAGDEDANGIDDLWEEIYGIEDPQNDPDADGLTNTEEYNFGTDPLSSDSDTDGIPDIWETRYGSMEPDADDDGDGLTNLEEYYADTSPDNPDSDGDGIYDGDEGLINYNSPVDIRLVAIYPEDDNPGDGIYQFTYGQTLRQIIVEAEYADGAPLLKPTVIGRLTVRGGTETVLIHFNRSSSKLYTAHMEYDILERNREAPFMYLEVTALDPLGNSGSLSERLFVMGHKTLPVEVVSPQNGEVYAYGQWVAIEVIPRPGQVPDSLSVKIFPEGSDEEFLLVRRGNSFVGDYQISKESPDHLSFLIYARAESGGETSEAVRNVRVNILPSLRTTFLPHKSSEKNQVFKITYPNGEPLREDSLTASIDGVDVEMERIDDGTYSLRQPSQTGRGISGEVVDSYGNMGRLVIPSATLPAFGSSVLQLALLLALLVVLLFLLRKMRSRRMEDQLRRHHVERLEKRKKQLKELIKVTRNAFYKRQMTQEEAARRIADYEAELKTLEMEEKPDI